MKVTFRQTGGFAGLSRGVEIEDERLPSEEAAHLREMVEQSRMKEAEARGPEEARDLTKYEITVETPEGVQSVTFDDMTVPPRMDRLLEYLRARARPEPLR